MYFKPYYLGCLAQASYLIGGNNGEAAVVDPRRDVEEYIEDAEAAGLKIAHVIETHLHADFVSGHLELGKRTGATIHLGEKAGALFPHHDVKEGDQIDLGDVTLRFLETPGHTPESVTIVAESGGEPKLAFTGDTLFIGDVGRPDLAGGSGAGPKDMARMMYSSLREKVLKLPDSTEVWPAHGAGSACGKALSNDKMSTIGREKLTNPALKYILEGNEEGFIHYATEGLSAPPIYFRHDAQRNREGARTVDDLIQAARALSPSEVGVLCDQGYLLLDVRDADDFASGHVRNALNVPLNGKFAPWVGNLIPPDTRMIVVAYVGREEEAITRLARVGYENITGWLSGSMEAWSVSGSETITTEQIPAEQLAARLKADPGLRVLDVRTQDEFDAGHVPGAALIPLPELERRAAEASSGRLAVMCRTGYRSSIACSILQRAGRIDVIDVPGGWEGYAG